MSKTLGAKISRAQRERINEKIAAARSSEAAADSEVKALERSRAALKFTSVRALPIVQAGVDLFFAYKAQHERLEKMHVDWLGREASG